MIILGLLPNRIVGAFVRLGALEPLHPNADEWLLQALHKHGRGLGRGRGDPAFDALRRGRNVPTLKAALARLVGADLEIAGSPEQLRRRRRRLW